MTEETKGTTAVENTTETTTEITTESAQTETVEASSEVVATEEVAAEPVAAEPVAEVNPLENVEVKVYNVGDNVKGTVVRLLPKAALVELDTKYTAVIPVGEIANVYYENIADAVQIGDVVECKVKTIDGDKDTLILSKKDFDKENAWTRIVELNESGASFDVIVTGPVKGGLVVDLGVRGFIPRKHAGVATEEELAELKGKKLAVKIIELDEENKKVVLSHTAVLREWKQQEAGQFIATLEVGQDLTGTVQRISDFGVFVNIGAVDGLVHISELSWNHITKPTDVVNEGDVIKVKVIKIDAVNGKVGLSIKSLLPQPWDTVNEKFQVGDIVPAIVKRVTDFGAFVEIAEGVEGLVRMSQLAHTFVKSADQVVSVGQQINVKILELDAVNKKASLSLKETTEKPVDAVVTSQADQSDIDANSNQQQLTTNIGEQFGSLLSKFKK